MEASVLGLPHRVLHSCGLWFEVYHQLSVMVGRWYHVVVCQASVNPSVILSDICDVQKVTLKLKQQSGLRTTALRRIWRPNPILL